MKKLLVTLLILCAGPVWAEWIHFEYDTDGNHYFYDSSTIQGESKKRVWKRVDQKHKNKYGWHSARALEEYDCLNKKQKVLQFDAFSGPSLRGEVLHTLREKDFSEWEYVAPGTIGHALLNIVCRKK
jgi:hypothetical protein